MICTDANVDCAVEFVQAHLDSGEYHPSHRDRVEETVVPQLREQAADRLRV